MASLIFAFIFGVSPASRATDGPTCCSRSPAMMAWNAFSQALTRVGYSLVANAQMVSKVYFPRLILPLASSLRPGRLRRRRWG